jgi:regulator of sigma E protease
VVVNLILGFLIYAMMLWYWGESYVPTNKFTYGIATDSLARSIGLRDGDKILSVDGEYIDRFNKIPLQVILTGSKTFEVDRDGQKLTIPIPETFAADLIHHKAVNFIDMRVPFLGISSVSDTSAAQRAGLQPDDVILAVNGTPVPFYHEFRQMVQKNREKTIDLTVLRGDDTLSLQADIPKAGVIGIYPKPFADKFEVKEVKYGFFEAIPAGFKKSRETLSSYWLQLKLIFSGKVNTNESLGSVISIGKMFAPVWDWQQFWGLTAFFSLVLALMNILPIPGLDGGHALFTIYEIVSGRKPGDKFMEYAQMVGMILLLGLMAYALGLDIFRLFK